METIYVEDLKNNLVSKDTLDKISESFEDYIMMRFYGLSEDVFTLQVNYEMMFIPVIYRVKTSEIFTRNQRTEYATYSYYAEYNYQLSLNSIPAHYQFMDVFGKIDEMEDNMVLTVGTAKENFLYKMQFNSPRIVFLGKLARIDEVNWKFHPFLQSVSMRSFYDIAGRYQAGEFL